MKKNFTKSLVYLLRKKAGRNVSGKITCRHKGGGFKLIKPNIDFWFANHCKDAKSAIVLSTNINSINTHTVSLIMFINGILKGKKRYIISTNNTLIGDIITFNVVNASPTEGSIKYIKEFPIGTLLHNLESYPNTGAHIARSNGVFAKIIYHSLKHVCIKLPSGEYKLFLRRCLAIFGQVKIKNKFYNYKAGFNRQLSKRPTVRGVAMNPIDHPHGGGTGKVSVGLKTIKSFTGKYSIGVKTRPIKNSTKLIIKKH